MTEFEHGTWFPGISEVVTVVGMITESRTGVMGHNRLLVSCKPNLAAFLICGHQHLIMVDDNVDPFAAFQTWVGNAEGPSSIIGINLYGVKSVWV